MSAKGKAATQKACLSPTGGGGAAQARRPSAGVIPRIGLSVAGGGDRRASAVSYLGTDFPGGRRQSAVSINEERRASSEIVHHSCLNPNGLDTESARRRPSADLFQGASLAPGGMDTEKSRRQRTAEDPIHHSCLSPKGLDSEKARRRPSTDMVQLSCLAPGGTDSDQQRRRLSVQTQAVRRASAQFRRPSTETDDRRASIESQDRRPSMERQADQMAHSSTTANSSDGVKNVDRLSPCIFVSTIDEESGNDQGQDLTEVDQWYQQPGGIQQKA